MNSKNLIILTINSLYYEVDTLTGEVVEYPFEKLDSRQAYDIIKSDNDFIIVVTSNLKGDLLEEEIFEELLNIEI